MAFQTATAQYPAPGIEGGWASDNPYGSLLTPNNGDPATGNYSAWTVGALGAFVGRFGWANTAAGTITSAHPGVSTVRVGFIHRDQPVVITPWLGATSLSLYSGQEIDICDAGDFWCRFAGGATIGQKVYASYADGSATAAATATPTTATGVTVSMNNSVNLTAVAGGTLVPGQPVSGAGIPAGAFVVSVSGTTAVLSAATTGGAATGVAVTQTTNFETRWTVDSAAAAGDVAKISTRG